MPGPSGRNGTQETRRVRMTVEGTIDYEALAQDAMRGVMHAVLERTAKSGLPGEHHFYISFDTLAPGAVLSKRLREKYPGEMTIVLQHRFWDLVVDEDRFEVKLTFDGIPERLVIPFKSIKVFFDPSVRYGLQFEGPDESRPATSDAPHAAHGAPVGISSLIAVPSVDEPMRLKPGEPNFPPMRAMQISLPTRGNKTAERRQPGPRTTTREPKTTTLQPPRSSAWTPSARNSSSSKSRLFFTSGSEPRRAISRPQQSCVLYREA
jgi:hypothetical protein